MINWTDEMITDLYNTKLHSIYIANKYNISIASVYNKRRKYGIIYKHCRINWSNEMIADLYNTKLHAMHIANKYNISIASVYNKRKEFGIETAFKTIYPNIWTSDVIIDKVEFFIKDLYNTKLTSKYISKKYGIGHSTVRHKRIKLGIKSSFRKRINWTNKMINDIKNPNLSCYYIHKIYKIPYASVFNKRKEFGIISKYSHSKLKERY